MMPRLKQPLFQEQCQQLAREDKLATAVLKAYDCIWTLVYRPDDITLEQRNANARANMNILGDMIETICGQDAFEFDPKQLSFPEEMLNPMQPAQLEPGALVLNETKLTSLK